MNRGRFLTAVAFMTMCAGCDGSPPGPPPTAIVTFSVYSGKRRIWCCGLASMYDAIRFVRGQRRPRHGQWTLGV